MASSASTTTSTSEFDVLRREATKLERHLEDRVARYQQLAQKVATLDSTGSSTASSATASASSLDDVESGQRHNSNGSASMNGGNNSNANAWQQCKEEEQQLNADISRTLRTLSNLIGDQMSPAAERSGKSQHSLLVKRYREILFDFSSEFQKFSCAMQRKRDAMELFANANTSQSGGGAGRDPAMEELLRERHAIHNSVNAANGVLGQASMIRADLRNQGDSLRGIQGTIGKIASNVPGLNRLMENIKRKRSKDDMIVSGVIATCVLFTLWYLFG
mmetsp:Transcript_24451/g.37692  ORF Transcript_24451/g.37692 Transcript_24451/m.37692 type:complete len:276 (+) Transcript_24451:160-987(+)